MDDNKLLMRCCGDVVVFRPDMDSAFTKTRDELLEADITFGVLEANCSDNVGIHNVSSCCNMPCSSYPSFPSYLKKHGFDVVSWASNHALDYGRLPFLETIDRCKEAGLEIVGAGKDEEEAYKYIIMERKGTKIAILSYCSILPQGYWAFDKRPGVNPARAYNGYSMIVHDQPGTPARMYSFADPKDLARMRSDIAKAKTEADIVMVSMHWGIHFKFAEIADYQREYAYAAIDAGADIILGHHAHVIKPIEVYKGKVIFYSFGNFYQEEFDLMTRDMATTGHKSTKENKLHQEVNNSISADTFAKATRTFPPDSYLGIMAQIHIEDKKIQKVSYKPVVLPDDRCTYIAKHDDPMFDKINQFVLDVDEHENIHTKYEVKGDEIYVVTE